MKNVFFYHLRKMHLKNRPWQRLDFEEKKNASFIILWEFFKVSPKRISKITTRGWRNWKNVLQKDRATREITWMEIEENKLFWPQTPRDTSPSNVTVNIISYGSFTLIENCFIPLNIQRKIQNTTGGLNDVKLHNLLLIAQTRNRLVFILLFFRFFFTYAEARGSRVKKIEKLSEIIQILHSQFKMKNKLNWVFLSTDFPLLIFQNLDICTNDRNLKKIFQFCYWIGPFFFDIISVNPN